MKILSNFDTRFDDDCVNDACNEFGKAHICFVRRDKIYVILKIVFPTVLRLIGSLIAIIIIYSWSNSGSGWQTLQVFTRIIVATTWLILLRKSTGKLIDYYMDFTIITPRQVTTYDQHGLFTRNSRSIKIEKIKSVRVKEVGFFRSLFNFGTIVFFSEWDDENGDIKLNFITNPSQLAKRVEEIIQYGIQFRGGNQDGEE